MHLHFRSVRNSQRLEHSPRNTTKNLRHEQRLHVLRREENRRESSDQNQAAEHSVPVPDPLRHNTIDEQSNDLSNVRSVGETGLPRSRDLLRAIWLLNTEFLVESLEAIEVVDERDVEALHDDQC